MTLVSALLVVLLVCQVLAWGYAYRLLREAALDVYERYRAVASQSTLVLSFLLLALWPGPWYSHPPLSGSHQYLVRKLGQQVSPAVKSLVFRGVPTIVLASLASLVASLLTQLFVKRLYSVKPKFRLPSGPFQNRN